MLRRFAPLALLLAVACGEDDDQDPRDAETSEEITALEDEISTLEAQLAESQANLAAAQHRGARRGLPPRRRQPGCGHE